MPDIKIGVMSEMPAAGAAKEFSADGKMICVANLDGTLSAIDNVCLHRGGPLGQGVIAEAKVICPWHAWAWDPKTGEAGHNPNAKLAVYPLRITGEDVFVAID